MSSADTPVWKTAVTAFFAALGSSVLLGLLLWLLHRNGIGSDSNLATAIMSALYIVIFFPLFFLLFYQKSRLESLQSERKDDLLLDELTKLYRSTVFEELATAQIELAKRNRWPVGLVVMDIDSLSEINEKYGYEAGNRVLRHFSSMLRSSIRESDLAARCDDDRFVLLLPDCDARSAQRVMQRFQARVLESPAETEDGEPVNIPFSCGVVSFAGQVARFDTVMGRADEALMRAKKKGANRIELF